MTKVQTENWPRVIDLEAGKIMVVTDLHGDWDAYQRYRDRFLTLHSQGWADYLVLSGDLIHRSGPAKSDASLEIVLDVLRLQESLGSRLIYLLGNHELPHIYSILLQKGNELFTPRFEAAMGEHRPAILSLFDSLPFYVRTRAGVTLCHAGATAAIGQWNGLERLFRFSHQEILQKAALSITPEERPSLIRGIRKMYSKTYNELVRTCFAVTGLDDPRYENFLIGTVASSDPDFDVLWGAMFTRNEYEYGVHGYQIILDTMLQALSEDFYPQNVMVTGHIDCRKGYKLVNDQQLRLASAKHAQPREAGLYLLFDAEWEAFQTAQDLIPHLKTVFRD